MPRTHILERDQLVPAPLDVVFEFFSRAENLETLTPDFLRFRIQTPLPIEMKAGTRIDYSIALALVPMRWRTHITEWRPGECFVDEQEKGPYSLWRHTHTFLAVPGGTRIHDRVEYQLPFGFLGSIAHALFVKRTLKRIFDHRGAQTASIFGQANSEEAAA